MSEDELQLHFSYEEKAPGSYGRYTLVLAEQHKKLKSSDVCRHYAYWHGLVLDLVVLG